MVVLVALATPNVDDAPEGAPRRVVSGMSDIDIEVVQFERSGDVAVPYFWVWDGLTDAFASALRNDPALGGVTRLEQTERGTLFKAEWEVDSPIMHCVAGAGGMVMQARGSAEEWRLKIWFKDGTDASAFQRCCRERGVPIEVTRLKPLGDIVSEDAPGVSAEQRDALVRAYRAGYFEEPRRVTQAELADDLGISSSAVGGRIRRGVGALIEETLIDSGRE